MCREISAIAGLQHIKGHVDDHVFLPADHLTTAEFNKNLARVEAIIIGSFLRVAQEARIYPSIAQRERFSVNADGSILQRTDKVFGGIHQGHDVAPMVPALAVGRGNKDFQRRIASTCAHTGKAGIDPDGPALRGDDGIGGTL